MADDDIVVSRRITDDLEVVAGAVRHALSRTTGRDPATEDGLHALCCGAGVVAARAGGGDGPLPDRSVRGLVALEVLQRGLGAHRGVRRAAPADRAAVSEGVIVGDLLLARASVLASDLGPTEAALLAEVLDDLELTVIADDLHTGVRSATADGTACAAAARFGGLGAAVPDACVDRIAAGAYELGMAHGIAVSRHRDGCDGPVTHRATTVADHLRRARDHLGPSDAAHRVTESFGWLCAQVERRVTGPAVPGALGAAHGR